MIIKINNEYVKLINYCSNKIVCNNYFDFSGSFELINDVLIIYWDNGIIHYYIKNNDIYEHYIFEYFDLNYYSNNFEETINWENCFKHWCTKGRLQNIHYNNHIYIYDNYTIKKCILLDNNLCMIENEKLKYNYISEKIMLIDSKKYKFFSNNIWVNFNTEFLCNNEWTNIKNYNIESNDKFIIKNNAIEITKNEICKTFTNKKYIRFDNIFYEFEREIYLNEITIPTDFDYIFYANKNEIMYELKNNKYDIYEKYLQNGGIYIDIKNIKIYENIYNIILNHTTNTIYGLDENIYDSDIKIIKNILNIKQKGGEKLNFAILNNEYYEEINVSKKTIFETIKNVYIVSNLNGGGAVRYLNDIINKYTHINYIYITSEFDLIKNNYNSNDLLFIQHLFLTDISIETLIKIKINSDIKIIISVHDFYWINEYVERNFDLQENAPWHSNYLKDIKVDKNIIKLFELADDILHPSLFTYIQYSKFFDNYNFNLVYHNDYKEIHNLKQFNKITNNTINIGIMHESSTYKGKEQINFLIEKYKTFKNYNIKYLQVYKNLKPYKEEGFNDVIIENSINGFFLLNKWGETHCYLLTKILNSGLPFLYNNLGAFKERILETDNCIKVYDDVNCNDLVNNIFEELTLKFEIFLENIIQNKNNNLNLQQQKKKYNSYYTNLFNNTKVNYKQDIQLYAIYFPQFHTFPENNINYYENFSDVQNLKKYLQDTNNEEKLYSPNLEILNLQNLDEYNITNKDLQSKQISIAKKYGLNGFAIYYYWFSKNTITNKNTIMENGYNYFFEKKEENFKYYFIWANEDWSNNPAFNTNNLILNIYDIENYEKNLNNLINYFKNENYLKINNKPVFYIHHPDSIDNLDLLYDTFNIFCLKNGFNGIHIMYNNNNSSINEKNMYEFHPNYKKLGISIYYDEEKRASLNYIKYIEHNVIVNNKNPNCIFFDFNNTARLYIPDKLNLRTRTIKNNFKNISIMIKKIIDSYKNNKKNNNILLINAWNEWGEKMNVEPSEEYGFKFLNIIKNACYI